MISVASSVSADASVYGSSFVADSLTASSAPIPRSAPSSFATFTLAKQRSTRTAFVTPASDLRTTSPLTESVNALMHPLKIDCLLKEHVRQ